MQRKPNINFYYILHDITSCFANVMEFHGTATFLLVVFVDFRFPEFILIACFLVYNYNMVKYAFGLQEGNDYNGKISLPKVPICASSNKI
jgi:hypothetical protein